MQLVPNDSNIEDISESEPILLRSEISQSSESSSSSSSSLSEITSAGANSGFPDRDLENLDANETCHLVNAEQPQCRICLDNEGVNCLGNWDLFHVLGYTVTCNVDFRSLISPRNKISTCS